MCQDVRLHSGLCLLEVPMRAARHVPRCSLAFWAVFARGADEGCEAGGVGPHNASYTRPFVKYKTYLRL